MNSINSNIRYAAILFDFDGTLTPSLPLWMKAYHSAMASFGIKMTYEEVVRACFYRPWREIVRDFELPSVEALEAKVMEGLEDAFVDAILFDGVMHALDHCRSKDTKLAIVTSSVHRLVSRFLVTHNIDDYFSSIVAAEHVARHKPDPEPVLLALSGLQLGTHESLMVGDSPADLLAAQAAKVDNALFYPDEHLEFYDLEKLRLHEPKIIFHKYADFLHKIS